MDKSVAYVEKASQKVTDKLNTENKGRRMQKANEFFTDLLISKFASTLDGLDAFEDEKELSYDLKKDELFKRDVYSVVEKVTPWLPLLGFLSGGITTAKHAYRHKTKPLETVNELVEPNVE